MATTKLNLCKYLRVNFAMPRGAELAALKTVVPEGDFFVDRVYNWARETGEGVLEANGWEEVFATPGRFHHPSFDTGTSYRRVRTTVRKTYTVASALRACGRNVVEVEV